MLCSTLSANISASDNIRQLSSGEWDHLKTILDANGIQPSGLLKIDNQTRLESDLKIKTELAYRIMELLKRGGQLAVELENLSQMGVWILTEFEDYYPSRFISRLGKKRPPVIFGAGDISLLNDGGLAIVGSRDVDEGGSQFTQKIASFCSDHSINVISGAARGVDRFAIKSAIDNGGKSVGVLADSLLQFIKSKNTRELILNNTLTVITHFHPKVGFSVSKAMSRNKLIYALSDFTLVVSSAKGSGGTWSGATEAMEKNYATVLVRDGDNIPDGNTALLKKGAIPFNENFDGNIADFLASIDKDRKNNKDNVDKSEQMMLNM